MEGAKVADRRSQAHLCRRFCTIDRILLCSVSSSFHKSGICIRERLRAWSASASSNFRDAHPTLHSIRFLTSVMGPQAVLGASSLGSRLSLRQSVRRSTLSHSVAKPRPLQQRSFRPTAAPVSNFRSHNDGQVLGPSFSITVDWPLSCQCSIAFDVCGRPVDYRSLSRERPHVVGRVSQPHHQVPLTPRV